MKESRYDYYQDWKGWNPENFGTYTVASSIYFKSELSRCGFENLEGMKLLEIGFGNGNFAGWAVKKNAQYFGIEAIEDLVNIAAKKGFSAYSNRTPLHHIFREDYLDIAVAFNVFEHFVFEDFQLMLSDIHTCLRKGGVLLFSVPSGDSPFARAIQHGDITHRQALGSLAVQHLAIALKYEVVSIRSPTLPLRGLGLVTFLRRALVQGLRAITYPVINNIFMDGGNWVLSPTMMCILRKP